MTIIRKDYNKKSIFYPIIIGGPGRAGKTYLASYLKNNNKSKYSVIVEDVNLHKEITKKKINNEKECKKFLKNYLSKSRYIDPFNLKSKTLIENFDIKFKRIFKYFEKLNYPLDRIDIIFNLLNLFTTLNKKKNWLVLDIHTEFFFQKYKKHQKDLKLIILLRKPHEVICSHLYWRNRKFNKINFLKEYFYSLVFWIVSEKIGKKLSVKYPEDVIIIHENPIKNKNLFSLNIINKQSKNYDDNLFFKFNSKTKKFLTYENKWKKLLTDSQIRFISYCTNGKFQEKVSFEFKILRSFIDVVVLICILNPYAMKRLINHLLYPNKVLNLIKNMIKKLFFKNLFKR